MEVVVRTAESLPLTRSRPFPLRHMRVYPITQSPLRILVCPRLSSRVSRDAFSHPFERANSQPRVAAHPRIGRKCATYLWSCLFTYQIEDDARFKVRASTSADRVCTPKFSLPTAVALPGLITTTGHIQKQKPLHIRSVHDRLTRLCHHRSSVPERSPSRSVHPPWPIAVSSCNLLQSPRADVAPRKFG